MLKNAYLKILLAMESNALSLDFAIFDVDLVANQNHWNVFADANQITMPVGNVFVSYTSCHVKHDDSAVALNVVTVTEASKLFLASCIPNVEANLSASGMEHERVDFNSESG